MIGAAAHETDPALESLLGELAEEYTQRVRRGERPDVEEYAKRHPRAGSLIREIWPALEALHALSGGGEGSPPSLIRAADLEGVLGDFRLIREIGRGGMGIVYEAEQMTLRRRVALKVLPFAAVLDQRQIQRFKNESIAAAQLDHPHIVDVFGVGCERGVHYYAMRYIEGQTLAALIRTLQDEASAGEHLPDWESGNAMEQPTTAAAPRPLDGTRGSESEPPPVAPCPALASTASLAAAATGRSAQRRAWFRAVAELGAKIAAALDHAHGQGIVHRDIKPSNLLLDAQGKVWICDFGLAHIAAESAITTTGDLLGTLRYMSPEQALARQTVVDHRTDVYSLGATLYELLTLEPIFSGKNRQELLRQISLEEPRPPRRIDSGIPPDLETIVLKAVAKDAGERYATAAELAGDLDRFLCDRPILARRPTTVQRLTKWSRRHKPLVWSTAVLTIVAVVGLAVATVLIERQRLIAVDNLEQAERQRKSAEANSLWAREAVDRMLTRVARKHLAYVPQMEQVQRQLLEDALEFYQRFVQDRGDDPELQRETVHAYRRVGEICSQLGRHRRAEQAFRRAIGLQEPLIESGRAEPSDRHLLAGLYHNLGMQLFAAGRSREAEEVYGRSMRLHERLAVEFPDRSAYQVELAASHNNIANLLKQRGDRAEALQHYRRAVELHEELVGDAAAVPGHRRKLAIFHCNLGMLLGQRGDRKAAREHYEKALELQTPLADAFEHDPQFRHETAFVHNNLASLLKTGGDLERAAENYRKALDLQARLVADFPSVPGFRNALGATHYNLGLLWRAANRYDQAARHYRRALDLRSQLAAEFPEVPEYRQDAARCHNNLGELLKQTGRREHAAEHYRQSLAIRRKLAAEFPRVPEYRVDLASSHFSSALLWYGRGERTKASEEFHRALALQKRLAADEPAVVRYRFDLARSHIGLGNLERARGNDSAFATHYRRAGTYMLGLVLECPDVVEYRRVLALVALALVQETLAWNTE